MCKSCWYRIILDVMTGHKQEPPDVARSGDD